jgi:hypothetical protein
VAWVVVAPKAGGAGGAAVALEVGAGESAEAITRIKTTVKEKRGIHFHFESMSERDLAEVAADFKVLAIDIQLFWMNLLDMR